MRFVKFRGRLQETLNSLPPDLIAYEEVRRHAGTTAAHVYGGLQAMLQAFCEDNKLQYVGVPVGTIKKFAAGVGNASKGQMMDAARALGFKPVDDNEADAIHLVRYAMVEWGPK